MKKQKGLTFAVVWLFYFALFVCLFVFADGGLRGYNKGCRCRVKKREGFAT